MRTKDLDNLPVIGYGIGLVVAGRLLGPGANPILAALVPASVLILGLVMPVAPKWTRRSLLMLAGGTFILGAASGAFFAVGGASAFGAPRWLAVILPATYILYSTVGLDDPSSPRNPANRVADLARQLVTSGVLLWVAAAAIVAADAFTRAPPTPSDSAWLLVSGAGFAAGGVALARADRIRRSPTRRHVAALRAHY